MTTPTPLTDALLQWEGRSTQDKGYRSMVGHARRLERRCAELEAGLRDIEMETRDGGQWTREEINEVARALLEKRDEDI